MQRNISNTKQNQCPRCLKESIFTDTVLGEVICGRCGLVLEQRIDEVNARGFSKDGEQTGGMAQSLARSDKGLTTIINPAYRDAFGRPLSPFMKTMMIQLKKLDNRSNISGILIEKNLRIAFSELARIKDKITLPDNIVEKSAHIYRKALARGLVKGRSIAILLGASVYAACRDGGIPRTLKDISSATGIQKRELAKCYRLLIFELDLNMPIADPIRYIAHIASNIEVSEKIKRNAILILNDAVEDGIRIGKAPKGVAAAAIYLSCVINGVRMTQKNIARASHVTEVTLRNSYKVLAMSSHTEIKKKKGKHHVARYHLTDVMNKGPQHFLQRSRKLDRSEP